MTAQFKKTLIAITVFAPLLAATSCTTEDPGPLQEIRKDFAVIDFDRLEMGSAFDIEVEQSSTFDVEARGDRRNVDDLEVFNSGSTLIVRYKNNANRRYTTRIRIKMPALYAVNFSGGSHSEIEGFESDQQLDLYVSGGSVAELEAGYRKVNVVLSGGSKLNMHGLGDELDMELSGASELVAFEYPVRTARANVSGASHGKITVTDDLNAVATGASRLLYRGSPSLTSDVSGASVVQQD